jgi:hypothetical protein
MQRRQAATGSCGRGPRDRSAGFAAFVPTGYQLPGFSATDWLKSANDRSGSSSCIEGYFTQGIIPYTSSLSGTYLGAAIIRLSG